MFLLKTKAKCQVSSTGKRHNFNTHFLLLYVSRSEYLFRFCFTLLSVSLVVWMVTMNGETFRRKPLSSNRVAWREGEKQRKPQDDPCPNSDTNRVFPEFGHKPIYQLSRCAVTSGVFYSVGVSAYHKLFKVTDISRDTASFDQKLWPTDDQSGGHAGLRLLTGRQ